jgi:hypothetical protein
VRRVVPIAALLSSLTLGACGGNEQTLLAPDRVSNDQALRLIRACDVTQLLTSHSGEVRLTLEGDTTTSVIRPDRTALMRAAVNASLERGCEIAVGGE